MPLSQAQRVQAVVQYLSRTRGVTQQEIGQELGYMNRSYFSQLINGQKNSFKKSFLDGLVAMDPEINPEFLTGQSNEILLPGNQQPTIYPTGWGSDAVKVDVPQPQPQPKGQQPGIFLPNEILQFVSDLSATIRSQQETIRMQQETIRGMIEPKQEKGKNVG